MNCPNSFDVFSLINPFSSVSEEHSSLLDFIEVVKLKTNLSVSFNSFNSLLSEETKEKKFNFSIICLNDELNPIVLTSMIKKLSNSKIVLFQPTMRFEPSQALLELLEKSLSFNNVFLITNNIAFLSSEIQSNYNNKIIHTHCVKKEYLNVSSNPTFTVALLDLTKNINVLHTDFSLEHIVPFLNGTRSRKIENLDKMLILSTLGMSSIQASISSLKENFLYIKGMCWNSNKFEDYLSLTKTLLYPSLQSKAFGRWGYIAKMNNIEIKKNFIHGYELFAGTSLEEAVEKLAT